ncbi:type II 3-dehydroquinate dehydratase [Vibrio chagasii]|nr:type II 3-dehydroquinate dehydratase [Vibrio chagasii]
MLCQPGAYTHTSIAFTMRLKGLHTSEVEVHILTCMHAKPSAITVHPSPARRRTIIRNKGSIKKVKIGLHFVR